MAFDGITVAALTASFQEKIVNGRIAKIALPQKDELLLTIKTEHRETLRLCVSANASLPLALLTNENRPAPMQAPNFCMLLRKYIGGGRIVSVDQPSLERIISLTIEHRNELGDLCARRLIIELMGKHSNIILCDANDVIIDAIKHVPAFVSSIREVLPGRPYFIANTMEKLCPLTATMQDFANCMQKPIPVAKALYTSFTGISPAAAQELCFCAGVDADMSCMGLDSSDVSSLFAQFCKLTDLVCKKTFSCRIYMRDMMPVDFGALPLTVLEADPTVTVRHMEDISSTLEQFYRQKAISVRIREHSSNLQHIVSTALTRNRKKYDLQMSQLDDTKNRDLYKQYGELLHTYGYSLTPGSPHLDVVNYYTGEPVSIPLDPTKDFKENAARYFDKYNKKKRTFEALSILSRQTKEEIDYLSSVKNALDMAENERDLAQIQEELVQTGIIRKRSHGKKKTEKSEPLHYVTDDQFHIYVGKNNLQNEWITFSLADGNDWWFHVKDAPGSHVVVRSDADELPDHVFEDAARLAAYYSAMRGADKVEVDYVQKKHIRKPKGTPPGFVVYYTNYSMIIDSAPTALRQISSTKE